MPSNTKIMEEIHTLCRAYLQHISNETPYIDIHKKKIDIAQALVDSKTPTEIINILDSKLYYFPENPSYSNVLQLNRTGWPLFLLKGLLVVITFPLSIPVLVLWSWLTRGTPNFMRTDGGVLVDKLLILCEGHVISSHLESNAEMNFLKKPTSATHTPAPKSEPHAAYKKVSTLPNSGEYPMMTSSKPMSKLAAASEKKEHTFEHKASASLSSTPLSPAATLQKKSSESTLDRDAMDAGLEDMSQALGGIYTAFFGNPEALLQSSLCRYTGRPVIIASRVRPSDALAADHLLLDVYCKFKWSKKTPQVITIMVLKNIHPILPKRPEIPFVPLGTDEPQASGILSTLSWSYDHTCSFLQSPIAFFKSPATFQELLQEGHTAHGFDIKEDRYLKALQAAQNWPEYITALEGVINELDRHREFIWNDEYYYVRSNLNACDFLERPIEEQNETHRLDAIFKRQIQTILDKISANIALLPEHYRSITPSANQIDAMFTRILSHLQNDDAGGAWSLFRNMPKLTAFIKYTFPHLEAMWIQLTAVFQLLDAKGYSMLSNYQGIPTESELRQYRLSVYAENHSIWCATINPAGVIDKFCIPANRLGRDASEMLMAVKSPMGLNSKQENLVYRITSERGYYSSNENGAYGNSPEAALNEFSKMQTLVTSYAPSLAERLQEATIAPLQGLMQASLVANQTTSETERRSIFLPEREETRRRLRAEDEFNEHIYFDPEDWDAVLEGRVFDTKTPAYN